MMPGHPRTCKSILSAAVAEGNTQKEVSKTRTGGPRPSEGVHKTSKRKLLDMWPAVTAFTQQVTKLSQQSLGSQTDSDSGRDSRRSSCEFDFSSYSRIRACAGCQTVFGKGATVLMALDQSFCSSTCRSNYVFSHADALGCRPDPNFAA